MGYLIRHLGRIAFLLFLTSMVSGVLLAAYYQPGSPYHSVSFVIRNVEFGLLIRGVHHWSAHLLNLLILLHSVRNLLQGRYKIARKSWIVGSLMGVAVLGGGFTGSSLIWDQRAYWATIIGLGTLETVPHIGGSLKTIFLGGREAGAITIGRFYALHAFFLPGLLSALIFFHLSSFSQLWEFLFDFLRRLRIVGTRGKENLKEMDAAACSGTLLELVEIFSVIGIVLILGTLFPPEIGQKADPFVTPSEVKPEWYFLFIYQGLKYVPKAVGVVLFLLVIPLLITLLPLLDRHPGSAIQPGQRPLAAIAVLLVILGLSGLTILGWLA